MSVRSSLIAGVRPDVRGTAIPIKSVRIAAFVFSRAPPLPIPSTVDSFRTPSIGLLIQTWLTVSSDRVMLPTTSSPAVSVETLPALSFLGSTAIFFRAQPGVVLKAPVKILEDQVVREREGLAKKYSVERQILDRLGEHPRIVRCLGWQADFPTGLLLAEASHGSLQRFLDTQNDTIPLSLRKKWFRQAIESVAYVHSRGVIHSDLRPDNFLVHATSSTSLDLWLCDFGGSTCEELDLDGGGLPEAGFFDPNSAWVSTHATDIFGLGSVLYTILTGHWPYRGPGGLFDSVEEMDRYETHVDSLFKQGIFPDVQGLFGGEIVLGCWTKKYSGMDDILQDIATFNLKEGNTSEGTTEAHCPSRYIGDANR